MPDAAWLHTLDPFAIRFTQTFGPRWYGLAYLAGFLVGWALLHLMARRRWLLLTPEQVGDAVFSIILGVFLGGRIGYAVFYQPSLFITFTPDPPWWGMLAIHRGGMASHGGMIGVILACAWTAGRAGVSTLHLLDAVAVVAPIGLFFGRVGNFINGELLGRIVARPGEPGPWWSVRFPQELLTKHRPMLTDDQQVRLLTLMDRAAPGWDRLGDKGAEEALARLIDAAQRGAAGIAEQLAPLLSARHPSQLYQALAEGPVLLAALWLIWRSPRRPGVIGAWFLMIYGALRIVTEVWRLPDDRLAVPRVLGLSRGQWLSAVMIVAGAAGLAIVVRRGRAARVGGWGRARPVGDDDAAVSSEPR